MSSFRRGMVVSARLDPVEGSEQAGIRPALIVSNDIFNKAIPIITVVPITAASPGDRIYASEVRLLPGTTGLRKESIALCHQIRTIAASRIGRTIGDADPASMAKVDSALRIHLSL